LHVANSHVPTETDAAIRWREKSEKEKRRLEMSKGRFNAYVQRDFPHPRAFPASVSITAIDLEEDSNSARLRHDR